jgi:hypothetical protein
MNYFAHISQTGRVKYRDVLGSIGVLESPDNFMPIGMASCKTWDEKGLAAWTLTVLGKELSGRWVLIGKRLVPAK